MSVVTRFPPSPTGYLHIGGARTALFSWLFAKKHQGKFVLRIEDTDRERSTEASVQAILDGMQWLGLDYDEGPYFQTKRLQNYQKVINKLLDQGDAYYCDCSKERLETLRDNQMQAGVKPKYDGKCRNKNLSASANIAQVVRFKNPQEGVVRFMDSVRGEIEFANAELDDLIIQRSDGVPTYHLTVVVDDIEMGMTHVIRGDDHLNNTPRQINLFKALQAKIPVFAHLPMILGEDGKRLSKRHGAMSVMQYEADGYFPEALLNYLVRLGWSHGDKELFSIAEMIQLFDLANINHSAASFSLEKLRWVNQAYMKSLPSATIAAQLKPYFDRANIAIDTGPELATLIDLQRERVVTLVEFVDQSRYFYSDTVVFDEKLKQKHLTEKALQPLQHIYKVLEQLSDWQASDCQNCLQSVVDQLGIGFGKLGLPLRVALTGATSSPSLDKTLFLLGKSRSLQRIQAAMRMIEAGD